MHVYATVDKASADPPKFSATLRAAQLTGKDVPPVFRPDLRVLLVDIKTNKESLVWLLNKPSGLTAELLTEGAMRVWTFTRRGALKEIAE
jgi:hypothetical protein